MNPRSPHLTLREALTIFISWRTPRLMILLAAVSLAVRAMLGPIGLADLLVLGVTAAIYPFFEWLFHKYILHARPFTLLGHRFHAHYAQKHRDHHYDPHDYTIWAMPVASSALTFVIVGTLALLLMPTPLAVTLMALVPLFALLYEWTHYLCHSSYKPRSRMYRRLKRNHQLHHFKNENYWWGVMTSVGDLILGTYPRKTEVPTSPTCRTLR